jgi:hypothetical protein
MKLKPIFIIVIFLILCSCSSKNKLSEKVNIEETVKKHMIENYMSNNNILPIKIEFGAIGKGANLIPTTFEITADFIRITTRDKILVTDSETYSIKTKDTKFEKLLTNFTKGDFIGNKHYYNPHIRDGEYMKISNEYGERKFSNTFSNIVDKSNIEPDTIGLSKFELISKYSNSLLREIQK